MHEMRRFYAGKTENCDQPVFYRFFAGLIRNVDRPVTAGPVRSKKSDRPVKSGPVQKNWTGSNSDPCCIMLLRHHSGTSF